MLIPLVLILSCSWAATLAGNDSSALNVTQINISTTTTHRIPSMISAQLPKAIRNKGNHTAYATTVHRKVNVTNVGAKHNKSVKGNATLATKADAAPTLSAAVHNLNHLKNGDYRSNSSRLLDRFASISKVSLESLSSRVSNASTKTSTLKNEWVPVNNTSTESKNVADRANRTVAKRSVQNSTFVDKASSFFQNLPVALADTTSNLTSWVKRLFTPGDNSSSDTPTKKVARDTSAANLKFLINLSETNMSSDSTDEEQSAEKIIEEEAKDFLDNSSPVFNLTSATINYDIGNLTTDLLKFKESNSSFSIVTKAEIEQDGTDSEDSSHMLNITSLPEAPVDDDFASGELKSETLGTSTNASLVSKSLDSPSTRTRRHYRPHYGQPRPHYGRPRPPHYMMMTTTTTSAPDYQGYVTPASNPTTAPVYGMPPVADAVPSYGMAPTSTSAPAPSYEMATTPTPASIYGMAPASAPTPAPATPMYGMAPAPASAPMYGMAPAPASAPMYGMAPAPASAPMYGMAPAPASAPMYGMGPTPAAAPSYGVATTPALAPMYGMAPTPAAAPSYGMSTTPAPAPMYGMAPAPAVPVYGIGPTPATGVPIYGMAPAAPVGPAVPVYGMAPVSSAIGYGMASEPASPANAIPPAFRPYGMAPVPSASGMVPSIPMAFGMTPAAPMAYGMVATTPSYDMQTESYYTAPQPMYTTSSPYGAPVNTAPYAPALAPAPANYLPKPYGGFIPSRPSATGSPWF